MEFTPKQKYSLLSKMGYSGSLQNDEMELYIQSNPGVATKMGKFTKALSKRGYLEGGNVMESLVMDKAMRKQIKNIKGASDAETLQGAYESVTGVGDQESQEVLKDKADQIAEDPTQVIQQQDVATIQPTPETLIDQGEGQVGDINKPTAETVDQVSQVQQPSDIDTATYDATTVDEKIQQANQDLEAATSEVGVKATVQGQLAELMTDFEDGTPPWASGAMRNASALMQQRGMGASSMAGQAIVQAAMEAALPIAVADARTYAEREMANLSNEQQTSIFKAQQRIQGLLSDQAATNAAKQFNAASENQTTQFMEDLKSRVAQFNSSQINSTLQFNAGQTNAMEQFNTQIQNQRDMFNAQNSLVIAQANAQWRQQIDTINTAEQNEANRVFAATANALTAAQMDQFWQSERDEMAFAFQSAESKANRDAQLMLARWEAVFSHATQESPDDGGGIGGVLGSIVGNIGGSIASSAGSAIGAAIFSDRRLKKDIKLVDTREDGLNVYKFTYKWSNRKRVGFMADEVEKIYPEAVSEENGFKLVDYNKVPGGTDIDIYGMETHV